MRNKIVKLEEVLSVMGDHVVGVYGPSKGISIDNLADVDHTIATTLDWVNSSKKNKQEIAESSVARVIIVDQTVVYSKILEDQGKMLIVVDKNPRKMIALVSTAFFAPHNEPAIHPTAVIDPEAKIGQNVYIGPYCVIGKATVGDGCQLESFVRIYDEVVLGEECHIYDHVVLGAPGFGVEKDDNKNLFRFPQIGRLIIGNHVDIGSLSSVDRGALSDTIIGDYTKVDSLCKIAHNNVIGKNVVITGCASIAGSNVIEDGAWIGPNSSLIQWGHIGKNAFVGMGSVVALKVKEGARVSGNPAKKLKID